MHQATLKGATLEGDSRRCALPREANSNTQKKESKKNHEHFSRFDNNPFANHKHLGEASLKNSLTEMGRTRFLIYQHYL